MKVLKLYNNKCTRPIFYITILAIYIIKIPFDIAIKVFLETLNFVISLVIAIVEPIQNNIKIIKLIFKYIKDDSFINKTTNMTHLYL